MDSSSADLPAQGRVAHLLQPTGAYERAHRLFCVGADLALGAGRRGAQGGRDERRRALRARTCPRETWLRPARARASCLRRGGDDLREIFGEGRGGFQIGQEVVARGVGAICAASSSSDAKGKASKRRAPREAPRVKAAAAEDDAMEVEEQDGEGEQDEGGGGRARASAGRGRGRGPRSADCEFPKAEEDGEKSKSRRGKKGASAAGSPNSASCSAARGVKVIWDKSGRSGVHPRDALEVVVGLKTRVKRGPMWPNYFENSQDGRPSQDGMTEENQPPPGTVTGFAGRHCQGRGPGRNQAEHSLYRCTTEDQQIVRATTLDLRHKVLVVLEIGSAGEKHFDRRLSCQPAEGGAVAQQRAHPAPEAGGVDRRLARRRPEGQWSRSQRPQRLGVVVAMEPAPGSSVEAAAGRLRSRGVAWQTVEAGPTAAADWAERERRTARRAWYTVVYDDDGRVEGCSHATTWRARRRCADPPGGQGESSDWPQHSTWRR